MLQFNNRHFNLKARAVMTVLHILFVKFNMIVLIKSTNVIVLLGNNGSVCQE